MEVQHSFRVSREVEPESVFQECPQQGSDVDFIGKRHVRADIAGIPRQQMEQARANVVTLLPPFLGGHFREALLDVLPEHPLSIEGYDGLSECLLPETSETYPKEFYSR